jgi:hypothetical protein
MKTQLMLAAAVMTGAAMPLIAQGAASSDPLAALLVEVRALRVAVERAASATPQVQLLAARLSVQSERVSRAAHDADAVHQELMEIERQQSIFAAQAAELQEQIESATDAKVQIELKVQQRALKDQLDGMVANEARLRARDADLANALAAEQTQWAEVNRRVDELERQFARRQQ